MSFELTGLVIFLLAIVPGFVAQQSRYSIVPRSLRKKSVLEETGDYVLDSVVVHGLLLILFRAFLAIASPQTLGAVEEVIGQGEVTEWFWPHRFLVAGYFAASLAGGFLFGLFRGILVLNQPVRNRLTNYAWFRRLLASVGIWSFLQEEPVWYGALSRIAGDELVFVQVKMKDNAGYYTGELRSYGILDDSERNKDFYLVNAHYKSSREDEYRAIKANGVLLNFGDGESIEVVRQRSGVF